MDIEVTDGLRRVQAELRAACERAGRPVDSVRLVAVSKRMPTEKILAVRSAGQLDFGENYAQELRDKSRELASHPDLRWHYIGPLQRNKVKYVVGTAVLLHAVESARILEEIERRAAKVDVRQRVLVQVNLAEEPQKSGATEDGLMDLLKRFADTPHVLCRGLMLMPPWDPDPEAARPLYQRLRRLQQRVAEAGLANVEPVELSMGMSHDFAQAVEEGATLVRVGTAIFGERPPKTW